MEQNKQEIQDQNLQYADEAFWTGHCHYLLQALALAMQRCQVWRLAATGDVFSLMELFDFAKAYDAEHPLPEGQFYRTTVEGAIGLCLEVEYQTKWLFTPMEPGEERDKLLRDLEGQLEQYELQENMERQRPQVETRRYVLCTHCGAKVMLTSKFCPHCRTRVNND